MRQARSQEMKLCVYCGVTATTRDHVPPRCMCLPMKVYPACFECNVVLGAVPFLTIKDRAAYLFDRYLRRNPYADERLIHLAEVARCAYTPVARKHVVKVAKTQRFLRQQAYEAAFKANKAYKNNSLGKKYAYSDPF